LNIISSTWLWDSFVLGEIYDGLFAVNPYNMAQDLPYIAKSWEISTYGSPAKTKITFHLREDVFWQDIPSFDRSAVTFDNGHCADGSFVNVPLTPVDVAFSWEYMRDNPYANYQILVASVDHVGINMDFWGNMWPYTTTVPEWWNYAPGDWQLNYVQHDATLEPYDIVAYLNTFMPILGLHRVGGSVIMPYHLWRYVALTSDPDALWGQDRASDVIDPWAYDMVYGTGPYILLQRTPGVSMTMIPFAVGQTYRGITLQNTYFYQPVRVLEPPSDTAAIEGNSIFMSNNLENLFNGAIDVTYYWDYDLWWWDGSAWVPVPTAKGGPIAGVTTPQVITLGPLSTTRVYSKTSVVKIDPTKFAWCDWFIIHESFHWSYNWDRLYSGYATDGVPGCTNYWSDGYYEFEFLHYHPGDWTGYLPKPGLKGYWDWMNELRENYLASDGKCDIKDLGMLGLHWQHKLPEKGGNPHPASATSTGLYDFGQNDDSGDCRRLDANNDGQITVVELGTLGLNWQKTWNPANHPRNPTSTETPPITLTLTVTLLDPHPPTAGVDITCPQDPRVTGPGIYYYYSQVNLDITATAHDTYLLYYEVDGIIYTLPPSTVSITVHVCMYASHHVEFFADGV